MKNKAAFILYLSVLHFAGHAQASTAGLVNKANRHYENKEYDAALNIYNKALSRAPESGIINYNAGTSLYKAGKYNDSIQHFQKALLTDDELLRQKASYNLGNALYKAGVAREKEDSGYAVLSLEKALGHYEEAIRLDGKDDDAKANHEFVKKEIERIKMRQTPQQNQDKSQSQPNDQSGQDKSGDEQQQQQQSGDSSDDKQEPQEDRQKSEGDPDRHDESQEPEDAQPQENNEGAQPSEQENQQGDSGNRDPSDYNNQMTQGTQGKDEGELTPQEAQMLLRGFEQGEQPQKLLNVFRGKLDSSPVEKDW